MSLLAYRYKRFHMSILYGWFAFGVLLGLVVGRIVPEMGQVLWCIAGLSLLPVAIRYRRWWACIIVFFAGLLVGGQRGASEMMHLQTYDNFIGRTVRLSGTISDDPQPDQRGLTVFSLARINIEGISLHGKVYVTTTSNLTLKRGDAVEIRAKVKSGFGSYTATVNYATVLAANSGATPIRDVRDHFSKGVRATVNEPEASLGVGFVVGQRSALPPELDEQLKAVGLTHIVVASGYNLTILIRFTRRLIAKHSRYAALATSTLLVIGFIAFSGLTPSMTRAGLVTLLSLLAWYYGRRFHPLLLIFFVAAATAYWDPVYVWGDMGWYLSFLAFGGVLIVAPLITVRLYRERQPGAISQLLIETIAAQLITLPLILFTFERLPLLSVLANVLVAPLIPFAMFAATVAGIAGMIAPTLLAWMGVPATILIGYCVAVVETLSGMEWAQLSITVPLSFLIAIYSTLLVIFIVWWRRTGHQFLKRSIVE